MITGSFPDADGVCHNYGHAGSAEATGTVLIINDTSGEIVSVTPDVKRLVLRQDHGPIGR